jgi:hypothetical protein
MLAPEIVIQKTKVSISNMMGNPNVRLVTKRSMVRFQSELGFSTWMMERFAIRAASA